jgi:sugar O-acyltransferase (sialic acid O-acetyltransferase NeuD family)
MLMQDVVIIGAGGFGREVLDVFDAVNSIKPIFRVLGFIVDPEFRKISDTINDKPILGGFDWLDKHLADIKAICGVGAPEQRFQLIDRARRLGVDFCSVIHPNAILTSRVIIGKGVVITAGCIFTNNIQIGDHVHVNLDCTVGHDVVIDDFVTISPGSHLSGRVVIHQGAFIGTGTNIIENINIGAWSTIGAGSTVIADVPENSVAVGLPAKSVKKKPVDWHLTRNKQQY